MTHLLGKIQGTRGRAVNCDGNYVGNATSFSPPLHVCVFVCVHAHVWLLLRVLSVETDLDVSRVASRRRMCECVFVCV